MKLIERIKSSAPVRIIKFAAYIVKHKELPPNPAPDGWWWW